MTRFLKSISVPRLCAIAVLVIAVSLCSTRAPATQVHYLIDLHNFKDVDTILVAGASGPGEALLPILPRLTLEQIKHRPPNPFLLGLRDVFSDTPWMTVKSFQDVPSQTIQQPNVLLIDFAVSARRETVGTSTVIMGSVGMLLYKNEADGSKTAVFAPPATYPFVVPATEKQLNRKLREAAHFLTGYFPCYFALANDKDCNSAKGPFSGYPYGAKETHPKPPAPVRSKIPQPIPGPRVVP